MKLLLVGPYPPPHGGISVHVRGLEQRSIAAGVPTRVLNSNNAGPRLILRIMAAASRGWTIHFHTNGHNLKSWILTSLCGFAACFAPERILTLHSGMTPKYLEAVSPFRRFLARLVCAIYDRVICVSTGIRDAITHLGVDGAKTQISEAYLGVSISEVPIDPALEQWMHSHAPILSTAIFFRPEYGFDVLLNAIRELHRRHPLIGCVVMGDTEHRDTAMKQAQQAGVAENVWLAGDLGHDFCLNVMARSDVFVRPTLEDGDSVSVREAIALGVPVVASAVGARPAEAILFSAGDVSALARKLQSALDLPRHMEQYA